MNYDEFKAEFIRENKKLKVALVLSLVIFSIGTVATLLNKRYYLYQGKAIFEERMLIEEVCRLSFLSLVSERPNPSLITKGILDVVSKDPFTLNVQKVLEAKSLEVGACKLVLKADGKLMAFKITMDESKGNPFYYKLAQVDELGVSKEEE